MYRLLPQAMPSGFDTCEQDFVFFRHHGLWALACFHRRQTDSDSERDVRMRSVALFSTDLAALQEAQHGQSALACSCRGQASEDWARKEGPRRMNGEERLW